MHSTVPMYLVPKNVNQWVVNDIHAAIASIGKSKFWVVDLTSSRSYSEYDSAICSVDYVQSSKFYEAMRDLGHHNVLKYEHPKNLFMRHDLTYTGDGQLILHVHHRDSYIKLMGFDVCDLPWFHPDVNQDPVCIKEVIFVGSNWEVHKAKNRYRFHVNSTRQTDPLHRLGFRYKTWESILDGLSHLTMYLVTDKGTVIEATQAEMKWLRPRRMRARRHYTDLMLNGYIAVDASIKCRVYENNVPHNGRFMESMATLHLTSSIEATRL